MQEFQKIFNKVQGKYVNYFTFKFGHDSVFNLTELFTKNQQAAILKKVINGKWNKIQ